MARVLTPDICVIGAGSGGLTVAAAAAAFGVDVVLIEKGKMGGDCLNYGCVPSKALISAARRAQIARTGSELGINADGVNVDFAQVHDHVQSVIAAIAPHDSVERFEGLGVTVIQEAGKFVSKDEVQAGETTIRARRFVIAAGSRPAIPPISGLDEVPYLTNETIFDLTVCPEHLIVIGAGPIGLELAQAHRRLGAKVTVVEAERALPREDPEATALVIESLRGEGVELLEKTAVRQLSGTDGEVRVVVEAGDGEREIAGSHVLVATGRKPNTDTLDLEKAGIAYEHSGITVDKGLRTTNRKVFAIGDIAGGLQFTHVAGYQAGLVIRSILFRLPVTYDRDIIPWVTYTDPEIAHIGLGEAEARSRFGNKVKVLEAKYAQNDRAQAAGATEGFVKLVVGARGRLLGADVVGASAGEIMNLMSLAVGRKLSVGQLAGMISPYPSLSEVVKRAAISYYSQAPSNPWIRRVIGFLAKFG
ncbi:dihydrolipoamide dehydrogenase [Stappia sp. GBMRC 2046]|uniref:Dihydrolipoamide dehydrogenase n=1 Tax=Stappia sediminis TaxID=2692190 RepID=A0A7X3LWK2_9HYPH|nr:FAD-dependent oxidoreductase [Stappia sediminis]MXN66381.1 dihydrolipoamide dehydrogenase [Stappia sediminis]